MRILLWHVHGAWTDAFVLGQHEYLFPTTNERGAWGLGRGGRDWPLTAIEVSPESLHDTDVDLVVLQRPEEIERSEQLLGRRLGRDIPAVYVEHNTPRVDVPSSVHPLSDRRDILLVHVTHFNRLMWDSGRAPTTVIEHGVPDPGALYTGELPAFGVVINEPVRRMRVTGSDLLPVFARVAPVNVFGMQAETLPQVLGLGPQSMTVVGDLPSARLHAELARSRVYLHPIRWTSLGLALIEAMHIGMPVLALATTEAIRAVPPEAGAISTDPDDLVRTAKLLIDNPDEARSRGRIAREAARERYSLRAFLDNWDDVLDAQTAQLPHFATALPAPSVSGVADVPASNGPGSSLSGSSLEATEGSRP